MAQLIRVSSMVEGMRCAIMIDDEVRYFPVHEKNQKKYVKIKGKRYHEHELPMGEEVYI